MIKKIICILSMLISSYSYAMNNGSYSDRYSDDGRNEQDIEMAPLLDGFFDNPLFHNANFDNDDDNGQFDDAQQRDDDDDDDDFKDVFFVRRPDPNRHTALPPAHDKHVSFAAFTQKLSKEEKFRKKVVQKTFNLAVMGGDTTAMQRAYDNGADINHSTNGITPLSNAFLFEQYGAALWLIEHKANIFGADPDGNTYLHLAVGASQSVGANPLDVVRALCKAGADPNAKNKPFGYSPIDKAWLLRRHDIRDVLLEYCSEENAARF